MTQKYDVAIIGAGTAGLSAKAEVAKKTDHYVVLDGGRLGTTCARVGCMPSKALIEMANAYHSRKLFDGLGLKEKNDPLPDYKAVMMEVRRLRDGFSGGVIESMSQWEDKLIRKNARFLDPNTLDTGDEKIHADKIIIATGAKAFLPEDWIPFQSCLVDAEQFFELDTLPSQMAVFGLGPIGIELGQALSRLGVKVSAITQSKKIGGLTDPELQEFAVDTFSKIIDFYLGTAQILSMSDNKIRVGCAGKEWSVEKVLTAIGRKPSVADLGLENLGVLLDKNGMPEYNPNTLQISDLPVFFAGDANQGKPLLHEATDEGRIAGYNAVSDEIFSFSRRVPLAITFSSPNIALAGRFHETLIQEKRSFITGRADFKNSGRAMMKHANEGKFHVYADPEDGKILGTEMIAPEAEHLGHLMAWAISANLTAAQILAMPFYHPVLEETLRSAFREIVRKTRSKKSNFEMFRCEDPIVEDCNGLLLP